MTAQFPDAAQPVLVQLVDEQVGALGQLRDTARRAGDNGLVSQTEALAAAECYARLAAAIGTDQDRREFVAILLCRADQLASVGLPDGALRREAVEHLTALAAGGDDYAAGQLETLQQSSQVPDLLPAESIASMASTFASAARGDTQALLGMADAVMTMTLCGSPRFEGLVQAEQYTRLGVFGGCTASTIALAGVLLLRWDDGEGLEHAVEALGLLMPLVEQDHPQAVGLVTITLMDLAPADLGHLVSRLPALLAHCSPEGNA